MWAGWNYFGAPRPGITPRLANLELPRQYEKYLADEKIRENADALTFDFDRDPATLARSRRIYDATSFVFAFRQSGAQAIISGCHLQEGGSVTSPSSTPA